MVMAHDKSLRMAQLVGNFGMEALGTRHLREGMGGKVGSLSQTLNKRSETIWRIVTSIFSSLAGSVKSDGATH